MNPRKKLRALLAKKAYTIVPGSYDVLTARLIQLAASRRSYLTARRFSRSNGYPTRPADHDRSHPVALARGRAVDIPVIGDMDAGLQRRST